MTRAAVPVRQRVHDSLLAVVGRFSLPPRLQMYCSVRVVCRLLQTIVEEEELLEATQIAKS